MHRLFLPFRECKQQIHQFLENTPAKSKRPNVMKQSRRTKARKTWSKTVRLSPKNSQITTSINTEQHTPMVMNQSRINYDYLFLEANIFY